MFRFVLSLICSIGVFASANTDRNCYAKVSLLHTDSYVYFNIVSSEKEGGGQRVEYNQNTRLRDVIEMIDDAALAGACDADHARSTYFNCDCSVEIHGDRVYKIRGCDIDGQPTYIMDGLRSGSVRSHLEYFEQKGYCKVE